MKIGFDLTEEDFWAFQDHFRKTSPIARKARQRLLLIAPSVTFALIFLLSWIISPRHDSFPALVGAIIGGVIILLWALFVLRFPRLFNRGHYKTLASEMVGSQTVELVDTGLKIQSKTGEGIVYWDSIGDITTTPEHTFIYSGKMRGLIIPQRRITSGNYPAFMQAFANVYAARRDTALENAPVAVPVSVPQNLTAIPEPSEQVAQQRQR